MSEELKPCPFCGGPAVLEGEEGHGYEVVCPHCDGRSGWGDYGYQAEAYWNKRSSRIQELEQKLRTTSLEALAISDANNELQAEIETAKNDLRSFMTSFVREHFFDNTGWQPLPDLLGMLSQMDNASTIARTYRAQATAAEARLSEAVKVLESIIDYPKRSREDDGENCYTIVQMAKAFITTLGGET